MASLPPLLSPSLGSSLEEKLKEFASESQKDLDNFDKNYLLALSGIFTFSVLFINEIVDGKIFRPKLLYGSWILFGIALGLILIALLISSVLFTRLWYLLGRHLAKVEIAAKMNLELTAKERDDRKEAEAEAAETVINTSYLISLIKSVLRGFSALAFIIGIAIFLAFVIHNLSENKNQLPSNGSGGSPTVLKDSMTIRVRVL